MGPDHETRELRRPCMRTFSSCGRSRCDLLFLKRPSGRLAAIGTRQVGSRAWARIAELARHVEIKRHTVQAVDGREVNANYVGKSNGGNTLVITTPEPGLTETVYCRNSKYAFALKRTASDASDQPWFITDVGPVAPTVEIFFRRLSVESFFAPQLSIGSMYLPSVYGTPSFVIKNVAPVRRGAETLALVTFAYTPPKGEAPFSWPVSGTFLLNPATSWTVVEYDADFAMTGRASPNHRVVHNTYAKSPEGVPIVTASTIDVRGGGQPAMSFSMDESMVFNRPPDADFTLPAFGLPEIGLGATRRLGPWALVGGGILMISAAASFFALKRKRRGSLV